MISLEDIKQVKVGDVLFSEEHECKVSVREVTKSGILCDWFIGCKHYQSILEGSTLCHLF